MRLHFHYILRRREEDERNPKFTGIEETFTDKKNKFEMGGLDPPKDPFKLDERFEV